MFHLALWVLQLVALIGGLIFLIMGIVKKSAWMMVLGAVLLLLPLLRIILCRFLWLAA